MLIIYKEFLKRVLTWGKKCDKMNVEGGREAWKQILISKKM